MRKLSPLQWLLLLPAFFLLLLCLGVTALVLAVSPPFVSVVAAGVVAVAVLWFVLVRRRGPGVVSESGLMGRQSSKDGLL